MTNNSGLASGLDIDGLEFDSRRVPFLYLLPQSSTFRSSSLPQSSVFRPSSPCKKSGARHFSSSHCSSAGRQEASPRLSYDIDRTTIIGVRYDLHGAAGATTTTRTPQQHSLHQRSANLSLPENATSKQKNASYPVLCLVLFKRVSIFDSTFRVGCLDPAKP